MQYKVNLESLFCEFIETQCQKQCYKLTKFEVQQSVYMFKQDGKKSDLVPLRSDFLK